MSKNEDDEVKTTLQWKLKNLPTGNEVASLVELGIISKQEARDILFKEINTDEKIKALEEQVEFLRGVVKDLSKNKNPQVVYQRITEYVPRNSWGNTWYSNTTTLCSSMGSGVVGNTAGGNTLTMKNDASAGSISSSYPKRFNN